MKALKPTSKPSFLYKLLGATLLTTVSASSFAVDATPFFSVYAGAGNWSTEASGQLGESSTDIEQLGLSDEDNVYFYLAFEHAVPVLPNVRLEHVDISSQGSGTVTETFSFGGQEFSADAAVDTTLDLTFLDAVLYYEIAMFDLGLTFRQFDAEVTATGVELGSGDAINEVESEDGVLPMLYVQTKIDLPFTGLYLTGNLNGLSVGDISVTDYRAAVGYEIDLGPVASLGLDLGYRAFELDLGDEESFEGDIELSGIYFGLNLKF